MYGPSKRWRVLYKIDRTVVYEDVRDVQAEMDRVRDYLERRGWRVELLLCAPIAEGGDGGE